MTSVRPVAAALLAAVALAHLARLLLGVELVVGGAVMPIWPSAVATVVAGSLAFLLWREQRPGR